MLALAYPVWRPPRSRLLLALGAGLAVAALSGWFGASPARSFWSTYLRMQGVVDLAHWFVLTAVAASVFRSRRSLLALLEFNLAAGLLVCAVAIAQSRGLPLPMAGLAGEALAGGAGAWRASATLGNSTYLGAYLVVNTVLAAGLLARSLLGPAPPPRRRLRAWAGRAFHGLAAWAGLWALGLSGSIAAGGGLVAAGGALAFAYAFLARSRGLRIGAGVAAAVVAVAAIGASVAVFVPTVPGPALAGFENPLLSRAADAATVRRTLGNRTALWNAGIAGFADRPLLGFGPENFVVAFGRHLAADAPELPVGDYPHNRLIEAAVTTGVAGLAVWLATWALTFVALVRAARTSKPRTQALALVTAAALVGYLFHGMTLFSTASSSWLYAMLIAVAVHLEVPARAPVPRTPVLRATALRATALRALAVSGALALAGAGLASNRAIHAGAAALYRAEASATERFMDELAAAVQAFGPLANVPRLILFENLAPNWRALHAGQRAEAVRLLAWAEAEAVHALAVEPENFEIHHALTRLYLAVGQTADPAYMERARHHFERSLELAPNRDPLAPPRPRN